MNPMNWQIGPTLRWGGGITTTLAAFPLGYACGHAGAWYGLAALCIALGGAMLYGIGIGFRVVYDIQEKRS